MRILVAGAEGQLGSEIMKIKGEHELFGFGKGKIDITKPEMIKGCFQEVQPDIVINCAAYTNVDGCESNQEFAYDINARAVGYLAAECLKYDAELAHISTDYVFDGKKGEPYTDTDKPNPTSVYGKSKLAGEEIIRVTMKKYYIIRTSWLYGETGKNFVKTMLELAKTKKSIDVVDDQVGSPTYANDLAQAIFNLISSGNFGTYHITNSDYCSWNQLAKKIFEIKGLDINVNPITTLQLGRPAPRPEFSVLDNSKLKNEIGIELRPWKEALEEFLDLL